ncbi:MAG: class I SAM-dependent methyltransferase [bacterium]|nr:class I SAM-dependent methyltransferase [bacterium]
MPIPKWQYDEFLPPGVDFTSVEEVRNYDTMHQKFRDYVQSTEIIVQALGLNAESTVIDMGSGTGAFTLHAAKQCKKIFAVDISKPMLEYCQQKAKESGVSNITFHHGGLLTYEHQGEPVDAMVCVAVVHHLPDFWKQIGLQRANRMIKPNGKLFLFDIVFSSKLANLPDEIARLITAFEQQAGAQMAKEAIIHIKEEYSTYDWIMEGILSKSGFKIDSAQYNTGFQATYICSQV